MKMTLGQIQKTMTDPGFASFLGKPIPAKASYLLATLRRKMTNELVHLNEQRAIIINKHAEKDGENIVILADGKATITPENSEAFNKDILALAARECNLGMDKVELDCAETPAITGAEADAILDIIELVG